MVTIPGILDIHDFPPAATGSPDLVIEIPHGATETRDFTSLAARLTSPLPPGLVDFFHVNTDAGAPELALAIAAALAPGKHVRVLRCRIPRTFIDCNRRIDAAPEDFKAGKVTPGLMPWITSPEDRALLRGLYDRYVAEVARHAAAAPALLLLHTYAPRSVDVEVDADIGPALRRAYAPDRIATFPLRPEIDVIARALDGTDHAPPAVFARLQHHFPAIANSATYPMHPSTLAWDHLQSHPGRAICIEVRRDLLADPFEPFAQMHIGDANLAKLAPAFADALAQL